MKSSIDVRRLVRAGAALLAAVALLACVSAQKRFVDEKRAESHMALARKLMEQQRLPEALTQSNLAVERWSKSPDAWFLRGQVHFRLALYPQAIEDFTAALERSEDFTEALSWRAWAAAESGDVASAERDWNEALTDPRYPTPEKLHLNLGLLLFREGRTAEGLVHLEKAVATNPGYARGYYELGKARQEAGDLGGATTAYEAALGGMKDSADLNLRLALALEAQGQQARAREHFKRVIELSPDGPAAELARDHLRRLEPAT